MKFHEPDLRGPSLDELKSRNQAAADEAREPIERAESRDGRGKAPSVAEPLILH